MVSSFEGFLKFRHVMSRGPSLSQWMQKTCPTTMTLSRLVNCCCSVGCNLQGPGMLLKRWTKYCLKQFRSGCPASDYYWFIHCRILWTLAS